MGLKDLIRAVRKGSKLIPDLDIFLGQLSEKNNFRAKGWHPSEFCGECMRKRVLLEILGKVKDEGIDPKLQRIFDLGTAEHSWYQEGYLGPMGILWGKWTCSRCDKVHWGFMPKDVCECSLDRDSCYQICQGDDSKKRLRSGCIHCKKWGRWEYKEVAVKAILPGCKMPVVGMADGLIWYRGFWILLEIKTINSRGFAMLRESAIVKHQKQTQIYGELICQGHIRIPKEYRNLDLPRPEKVLFLYINKDTCDLKEFWVDLVPEQGLQELKRPIQYETAMAEKEFPPREPGCSLLTDPTVKKCPVGTYCFGGSSWTQLERMGK